jgi:hypothetical protein
LTALPAAEIETIRSAGNRRVDVHANFGVPLSAIAAAPAGNVEWDRNEVALLNELYIPTHLDDFAGVFVAENHPDWSRKATPIDVLVTTADVGNNKLDNDAVVALPATRSNKLWIVQILDLQFARSHICYCAITCHELSSFFPGPPVYKQHGKGYVQ